LLIWSESAAFFTFGVQKVAAAFLEKSRILPGCACKVEVKMRWRTVSWCKANSGLGEDAVDLDIRQSGTICCLKLKGPLKYGEGVKQLDEAVEGALSSGHIHLLLDLSAMPYIDSSGIGAIVDALRQARKVGGDVKLVNPSAFAAKTFKMVGILPLFKVYSSEAEAMQAYPA
jgi:anti-sigma B factor antagonist